MITGKLLDAGANGSGIKGLLRAVYEITGLPVVILDTLYRVTGFYGPNVDPEDCARKDDDDPVSRRTWRKKVESSPEPMIDEHTGGKYRGMCMDVIVKGEDLAKIAFFETRPFCEEDRQVMLVFSRVLACLLQGSSSAYSGDAAKQGRQMSDLLREMIRGNVSARELHRINTYYNLPTGNEICVIVLEEKEGIHMEYEAVIRQLHDIMDCICTIMDEQVVCLCSADLLRNSQEQIRKTLSFFTLRMGKSRSFIERSQTRDYYLQAQFALAFAQKQDLSVMRYEDCFLEDVVSHCLGERHLRTFCKPEILKLIEYDRANKTQYADTFYIYCKNLCSLADTSKETFLHYNTIKYRIRKFREIAGIDHISGRDLAEYLLTYVLLKQV